jgi:DNA polymerase I
MDKLPFQDVWLLDFEFEAPAGERQHPLCMVAVELRSGRTIKLWRDELYQARGHPPFDTGPETLFVAYFASAELGCFLGLDWPLPGAVVDLFAEFRVLTNGLPLIAGAGLVGACQYHGIPMMSGDEKDGNRAIIMRGGPWTTAEVVRIVDYCCADVEATRRLFLAMLPGILTGPGGTDAALGRGLLRGRYMGAVAEMEYRGVPIDIVTLAAIRDCWGPIRRSLIQAVDVDFCVYDNGSFRLRRFAAYLDRKGIHWPLLASGALDLSRDTFRQQARAWPEIAPLHELRATLGELRLNDLTVGKDGRNRCLLSPFRSRTGRNQPSNSKFIFGPATWIRHLIVPPPGRAIIAADYSAQEIAIAAALSRDPALIESYRSGDPYLQFAKLARLVPQDATKKSHAAERDRCKAVVLGTNYGMRGAGLALRTGLPIHEANHLLRLHGEAFPRFWRWVDEQQQQLDLTRCISTCLGWQMHALDGWKPTAIMNWPMQSHGAEILRLACVRLHTAGLAVIAPVHDAVLVEVDEDVATDAAQVVVSHMQQAAAQVLDTDWDLRVDHKILRPGERYSDPRGVRMWETVTRLVANATARRNMATSMADDHV